MDVRQEVHSMFLIPEKEESDANKRIRQCDLTYFAISTPPVAPDAVSEFSQGWN